MQTRVGSRSRLDTWRRAFGFDGTLSRAREFRDLGERVSQGLDRVDERIVAGLRYADEIADASTRHLLESGGKRIRPGLTLICAQLGNGATDDVINAAAAIEITHVASLYHDDVMDSAELRRGVPAAHMIWDNSVAILSGDLLFARASQIMASLGETAIRMQADTFERLVLGQLRESVGPRPGEDPEAHYISVLRDKTGSLIAAAARAGVLFSRAPVDYVAPLERFGELVGVAFQLVDDIIDLAPDPKASGKLPGTDLRAGVTTLPMLRLQSMAHDDAGAARLLRAIETEVKVDGGASDARITELVGELRDHRATEQASAEARSWAARAVESLEPVPDGEVKSALRYFAESVIERRG